MFKKFAIVSAFIITLFAAAFAVGCGTVNYDEKYADRAKVVFELEGGRYQNSTTSVTHYYTIPSSGSCKIVALEKMPDAEVTRDGGFKLVGWFKTKTVASDGTVTYSDEWNFDVQSLTKEGVTLYAKWAEPIEYTFDFVYIDENGEEVITKQMVVNAGNKLGDVYGKQSALELANARIGYTAIGVYYDKEHTVPFDDSVAHPGGESSFGVKLYVDYIEGNYLVVESADQLKTAPTRSIYLAADIDMEGKELDLTKMKGRTFIGNNHKIYNFAVAYNAGTLTWDFDDSKKRSLCIAIFGNAENVTVKDVTFEDVTVTVDTNYSATNGKIYVAPLAVSAKGCTFENVTVKGTFGYTKKTANKFNIEEVAVFVTDKAFYLGENSSESGCRYEIENIGLTDE